MRTIKCIEISCIFCVQCVISLNSTICIFADPSSFRTNTYTDLRTFYCSSALREFVLLRFPLFPIFLSFCFFLLRKLVLKIQIRSSHSSYSSYTYIHIFIYVNINANDSKVSAENVWILIFFLLGSTFHQKKFPCHFSVLLASVE